MSDKKNELPKKTDVPTKKDTGIDHDEYRRNYDSGRPSSNKSDQGTSGTVPREKKG